MWRESLQRQAERHLQRAAYPAAAPSGVARTCVRCAVYCADWRTRLICGACNSACCRGAKRDVRRSMPAMNSLAFSARCTLRVWARCCAQAFRSTMKPQGLSWSGSTISGHTACPWIEPSAILRASSVRSVVRVVGGAIRDTGPIFGSTACHNSSGSSSKSLSRSRVRRIAGQYGPPSMPTLSVRPGCGCASTLAREAAMLRNVLSSLVTKTR